MKTLLCVLMVLAVGFANASPPEPVLDNVTTEVVYQDEFNETVNTVADVSTTIYEPVIELTDLSGGDWNVEIEVLMPSGEDLVLRDTGLNGNTRFYEYDIVTNGSVGGLRLVSINHVVTKQPGETHVKCETKKDGKKEGQAIIVYTS